MHTKEELVEKRSKLHQLDLVEEVSAADKIAKKRRHLFIAVFATIGLSLAFWLFRLSQSFLTHPADLISQISFTLPQKNISSRPADLNENLESQINQIISSDANHWSISVALDSTVFNWSKNKKNITPADVAAAADKLIVQKKTSSKIDTYLPQGVIIKEIFSSDNNSFSLQSLILVPQHQILFFINYLGPDSFPPPHFPELISALYWSLAPNLTN